MRSFCHYPLGSGVTLALVTWGFELGRLSHVAQLWRWRWICRGQYLGPTIDAPKAHSWWVQIGPLTLGFTWRVKP